MTKTIRNKTRKSIIEGMLLAFISLVINGFGIYLTIKASIGAGPWDVLSLGISKTFGILYGNVSIMVSIIILIIDIYLKEPIGIAMIIDAITVGKSVDLFNYLNLVKAPKTIYGSILLMIIGLFIIAYTQFTYMYASLGCGPRDTLIVGLSKRIKKIKIGHITMMIHCSVTFIGYLLGGPVGIGTLICAMCSGPIMQFAFDSVNFDATLIKHQSINESIRVFMKK